jgi:PAS domain S-box-containing protein
VAAADGHAPGNALTRRAADAYACLAGDTEMARLMRAHDWAATPLGPPAGWPAPLRIVLRMALNSRFPMFVYWGPLHICLYNDGYRALLGPETHPGALGTPAAVARAELWPMIGPEIERVRTGGGATWNENRLVPITRHGRLDDVYWTYSYSAIEDEAGQVLGVLAVANETTAQVLAERRQEQRAEISKAEHDRLAALFAQAPSFMALLSGPVHRFSFANAAYLRLVGDRPLLGRTVAEALPEAATQGYLELLDQVYRSGEPYTSKAARFVVEAVPGARRERFVDFIYQPIRDDAGTVTGVFVLGTDTTDRTTAEAELQALNAMLEAAVAARTAERDRIWRHSADLLLVLDLDGVILATNPAWEATLGFAEPALTGRKFYEFLHADDHDDAAGNMELVRGEKVLEVLNRYRHRDGGWRWISWTGVTEGGKVYCVGRDVTLERQRAEELARTAEALRQAQKMEAIGHLTGGIAHDFNNMLQGITAGIALAERRIAAGRAAEAGKFLDAARESANRASQLTQRLLSFGRRQALDPKPLAADELVRGMAGLIERTVGPEIVLELLLAEPCWPVRCDRNQLENALLNLAINARDAMRAGGGRLLIETAQAVLDGAEVADWDAAEAGDYVRISVVDTGAGMPPDVLAHAFEPFFTTKPAGQGTGLGLSQLYGFVRQSSGVVRMQSQPGAGTAVHVFLPRSFAPAEVAAGAAPPSLDPRPVAPATVLLVEDEATVRNFAAEALRELGYRVVEAADGPAGLTALRGLLDQPAARPPALLVTDVGLPGGVNGRQLADAARALLPDLPVLLITGYAGDAINGAGALRPGMEILRKPFELDELGRRMRAMMEGAKA